MADKQIGQSLNKVFSNNEYRYFPIIGKENYIKVALESSIAFCYIDCYQFKGIVQHQLITIISSNDFSSSVFKNSLNFDYMTQIPCTELNEIKIQIMANPNSDRIGLVKLDYFYKTSKKTKLAVLAIDIGEIKRKNQLILEEITLNRPPLQARWHLYESNYIIILTDEVFQIVQYLSEEIQTVGITRLKNLSFNQKIVDFCFWPIDQELKFFKLFAIGDEGALYVLLLKLGNIDEAQMTNQQLQNISQMQQYDFKLIKILERGSDASFTSINAYSPSKGVTILVKRAIKNDQKGQSQGIVISAVLQIQGNYAEKLIVEMMSDVNHQIEYPKSNLFGSVFYFWQGGRLLRMNLNAHLDYLKSLVSNQLKVQCPKNEVSVEVLFQINCKTIKFVEIDSSSIKILRKAETYQQYLFSTIEIQACNLLFEQQSATEKLQQIFNDLSAKLSSLRSQDLMISTDDEVSKTWKELKEVGSVKQIQQEYHNANNMLEDMQILLQNEQKELKYLYEEASQCSKQFQSSKHHWRELQSLVNRIEANAQQIDNLQQKMRREDEQSYSLESIKRRCQSLNSRRMDIDQSLRQEYMDNFKYQYQYISEIQMALQQNERRIKQLVEM